MTVQHIKKEVLKLDITSRSKLASALLSSLENLSESENEKQWAEESLLRSDDYVKRKTKVRSAKVVFKNARTLLK